MNLKASNVMGIRILQLMVLSFTVLTVYGQGKESQEQRERNFVAGGQWANYGNDPGGMRFSPLKQINAANVKDLKLAWTYQSGELKTYEGTNLASKAALETTPLMIDGVLYFSTPTNRIIAIDAATGKERWVFDSQVNLKGGYSEVTSRGVSEWINSELQPGDSDYMRIIAATIDGRLIALESSTGKLAASFGKGGIIDLKE